MSCHVVWEPGRVGALREMFDATPGEPVHAVDPDATRRGRVAARCGVLVTVLPRSWDTVEPSEKCRDCEIWVERPPIDEHIVATAHREAGHAVMACVVGLEFDFVTVWPDPDRRLDGEVGTVDYNEPTPRHLVQLWAGQLAEERFMGAPNPRRATLDDARIKGVAGELATRKTVAALMVETRTAALEKLATPRGGLGCARRIGSCRGPATSPHITRGARAEPAADYVTSAR